MPSEILLTHLVQGLVESVSKAQATLDDYSMRTLAAYHQAGMAEELAAGMTWYAIPETTLDLKVLFSTAKDGEMTVRTVDSATQNTYQLRTDMVSKLRLQLKRMPGGAREAHTMRLPEEVYETVMLTTDTAELLERYREQGAALNITFYPYAEDKALYAGGRWFADVLYLPTDATEEQLLASFVIDDESGALVFGHVR